MPARIPFPVVGEHVSGYVRRLASANGAVDLPAFNRLWNMPRLSPTSPSSAWRRLKAVTGLPATAIDELRWPRVGAGREVRLEVLGRPVRRIQLDLDHMRRCTECLGADHVLRVEWSLRHVTACPAHRTQLTDECLGCGRTLLLAEQSGTKTCSDCGTDFAGGRMPAATREELGLSSALASALLGGDTHGRQSGMPPGFRALPLADAAAVVDHLRRFVTATDSHELEPQGKRAPPPGLDEARRQALAAARLLSDWPGAFIDLVGSLRSPGSARTRVGASHRQFAGRAGRLLSKAPTTLDGGPIPFLADAIRDVHDERTGHRPGQRAPGSRPRPAAEIGEPTDLPPISHADAMLRLEGRSDGRLARWWIDAGLLKEMPAPSGRAVLATDDVEANAIVLRFVACSPPADDPVDVEWIDRSVTCRREYDKSAFLRDLLHGKLDAWVVDDELEGMAALRFSKSDILRQAALARIAAWVDGDAHVAMTRFRQVALDVWPPDLVPDTASARDAAADGRLRFVHYDPPGSGRRQCRWHVGDLTRMIGTRPSP